jgi:DNA-binding IclR family transcriptional regulator
MDSVHTGVQTLDRSVSVLEAVAVAGPSTLSGIVDATGLARPTAHRLAVALERHGLLARDGAGRFRLGGRLVAWGAQSARSLVLVEVAGAVLADLVEQTGESAQLYVREADRRVCVAAHERPRGLRDTVPLGAVMPLDRGSGGKVLLAWATDGGRHGVDARELAAVRRRGWAESVGEREPGVASVSAPVHDGDGAVIAAVSVSGPADRMGARPGRRFGAAVVAAASRLTAGTAGAHPPVTVR